MKSETAADALIIAAGSEHCRDASRLRIAETGLIICADAGIVACRELGLRPDFLIGDLDSAPAELVEWARDVGARILRHPVAKDETDLELALAKAIELGACRLVVTGATGGRVDHTLANMDVLMGVARRAELLVAVEGWGEMIFLAGAHRKAAIHGAVSDVVSLIPRCGEARGVTTAGLHYPLRHEDLCYGTSRGVSNRMTEPVAHVTMVDGEMLVIHVRASE